MKKNLFFIFTLLIVFSFKNYSQSPITYSIFVNSLPTCSTCCDGGICVTSPSGGCNGAYTAEWSTGNTGPASCSPGMYCYSTTYTICVYDICDTTCKTYTMPSFTGIAELKIQAQIKVFPNPTSSTLFISSEQSEFENSKLEITNVTGQLIFYSVFNSEIDVSKLTQGIYYLKVITTNKQAYYSKFIKELNDTR